MSVAIIQLFLEIKKRLNKFDLFFLLGNYISKIFQYKNRDVFSISNEPYNLKADEILLSISLIIFLAFNILIIHITIAMITIKGHNNPITTDVIQTALLLYDMFAAFPSMAFLAQTNNIIEVVNHTDKNIIVIILKYF